MRLHAQAYAYDGPGFYFDSLEMYEQKYEKHLPFEEYEIEFIDGTNEEAALFKAADVSQASLGTWFEVMGALSEHQLPALYYLMDNLKLSIAEAADKVDELAFREGTTRDWAESYVDDQGGPAKLDKKTIEMYFDYDAFAHDTELNGDIHEFEFGGTTYTAEPNSV